jgi:hypothetical protein
LGLSSAMFELQSRSGCGVFAASRKEPLVRSDVPNQTRLCKNSYRGKMWKMQFSGRALNHTLKV